MDYKNFRAINQFSGRSNMLDIIVVLISQKMRYIFLFILVIDRIRKGFIKHFSLLIIASIGLTLLLEAIIKCFYFRPRPFVNHIVNTLPPFPSEQSSSFPSRHTTLTFAVATSVMLYKRVLGVIMYILACVTGFSRIMMGHHYPLDIVGSALLGSCSSLFSHLILNKMKH
ncbi:MAG: phosphatase PAP2 family protein [Bacillus sp. (in: firmicutes)]